ncbi:MAG TPA: hypothetical protein VE338_16695, partial [Ktedonobacterales bacterium]|nr:hypothetical protein [Ktedonobacterales bacterium]
MLTVPRSPDSLRRVAGPQRKTPNSLRRSLLRRMLRSCWPTLLGALLALILALLALHSPVARLPRTTASQSTVVLTPAAQAGWGNAQSPAIPAATQPPDVGAQPSQSPTTPTTATTATTPATPTSPQASAQRATTPAPGLPDPGQWVQQTLLAALTAALSGLVSALQSVLTWASGLGASSFNFIMRTPPEGSYQSASVVTLWTWVVGVADAALALLTLWGGYNVIVRHALGARYASAMELLPRLALAALAANLSLLFSSFFVDLNNALCAGVGQVSLPGYSAMTAVTSAQSAAQDVAGLLLALIYGVVGLLLVLQMLLRLALLDLLIVAAPLGLLCWALPQTQAWSRLWTSTFVATALVQFLQILTLRLG